MDCEKFDQHVIDELYDELDELTHAALKRHVEGCSRCAGILSGLRATHEVGVLPLQEPSEDLEARILDAVTTAQRKAPWPRKLLRGLAWAGSHAMRPQLAMAALFFLVIGSSLLLLRAKPGTVGAPVRVTENGAPTPDQSDFAAAPAVAAPSPAAAASAGLPAGVGRADQPAESTQAMPEPKGRDEASKELKEKDSSKAERADKEAAKLAIADARALRDTTGCPSAVSKFDEVGTRFPGTGIAADAMWEAAACYKLMGELDKAHQLYLALKSTGGYRERAERELEQEASASALQNQMAARAPAKSKAAAPSVAPGAASASASAPPPPSSTFGSASKATAAPRRAAGQGY
jgi:hypothetical protein